MTQAVLRQSDVSDYHVQDTEDAELLRLALNCTSGEFRVNWQGSIFLANSLRVLGGTSLHISGVGNSPSVNGRSAVGLFIVEDGLLHIENLSLVQGNSTDGSATHAVDSVVSLRNCSLRHNHANKYHSMGDSCGKNFCVA